MNLCYTRFSRRLVLAALLCGAAAPSAFGRCNVRSLGVTKAAYLSLISARMSALGVAEITPAPNQQETVLYALKGVPAVELGIEVRDRLVNQIASSLTLPSSSADLERAIAMSAFAIAQFSDVSETQVKDDLYASVAQHVVNGSWAKRWGVSIAVFTRSSRGLVIKSGKLDCST